MVRMVEVRYRIEPSDYRTLIIYPLSLKRNRLHIAHTAEKCLLICTLYRYATFWCSLTYCEERDWKFVRFRTLYKCREGILSSLLAATQWLNNHPPGWRKLWHLYLQRRNVTMETTSMATVILHITSLLYIHTCASPSCLSVDWIFVGVFNNVPTKLRA